MATLAPNLRILGEGGTPCIRGATSSSCAVAGTPSASPPGLLSPDGFRGSRWRSMDSCWCPPRSSSGGGRSSRCTPGSSGWRSTTRSWPPSTAPEFAERADRDPGVEGDPARRRAARVSRSTRCATRRLAVPDPRCRRARARLRGARLRLRRAAAELARRLGRPPAVGLALKHDLVPVGAYFLGRSRAPRPRGARPSRWTVVGAAAVVALLGLLDDFFVPISWWRDSAVVDYFHKQLGYDYHGTGGLAGELRLQHRRRGPLPAPARLRLPRPARERVPVRRRAAARRGAAAAAARSLIPLSARDRGRGCSSRSRARRCSRSPPASSCSRSSGAAGGRSPPRSRRWPSASRGCTSSRTSRRRGTGRSRTSSSSASNAQAEAGSERKRRQHRRAVDPQPLDQPARGRRAP